MTKTLELAPEGKKEITGIIVGIIWSYATMEMLICLEGGCLCRVKYKHGEKYTEGTKVKVQARWTRRVNKPRITDGKYSKIKVVTS